MTDRYRFDLAPSAEFADQLESRLLRVIGDRTAESIPNARVTDAPDTEETIVSIDIDEDPTTTQRAPRRWAPLLAGAAAVILLVAGIGWIVTPQVSSWWRVPRRRMPR